MKNFKKVVFTKIAGIIVPVYLYLVELYKDDLSLQDIDKLTKKGYSININDGVISSIEF